jgi:hypothetical protein
VDVTAQARQWVSNPGSNFGLALAPAPSAPGTVAFFDSKENTATGHVARLDLTLSDQGPQGLPGHGRPVPRETRATPARKACRAPRVQQAQPARRAQPVPPARPAR